MIEDLKVAAQEVPQQYYTTFPEQLRESILILLDKLPNIPNLLQLD